MAVTTKDVFTWAGIGLAGYLALNAVGNFALNRLSVTPHNAQVDLSLFPAKVRVNWPIAIGNNTGITITTYSLYGQAFFGDVKLADISLAKAATIYAGQTTVVEFNITVPVIQSLGDLIASIISGGAGSLLNKLYFKGTLRTSAGNFPINRPIPLAL